VVRDVMEGIYRKFDQNGVRENDEALRALLESGLEMVQPAPEEVAQWREIVNRSHQQLAQEGVFDMALLERVQNLLGAYREGRAAGQP
jgi:TRAP-type C4-dicarboxylate transport system substrate-binding protein